MWLFWLIVVVVGVWLWVSKKSKSTPASLSNNSPEITVSVPSNYSRGTTRVDLEETENGGYNIGSNLPLSLTLYGLDKNEAEKLATAMQQDQGYEINDWFSHLVAQKNVRCKGA
jgi:hypothetical protein